MVSPLDSLPILYETIDARMGELNQRHVDRLQCHRGCSQCCVDELTVQEIEAAHIERAVGDGLRGQVAGAPGACAFLDENQACRIYEARPYVCRTQGPPIRWSEGEAEHRDICPLNDTGPPITELPADACWTIGPVEERISLLQAFRPSDERVALRALFSRLASQ
ncbi:MAG: YkgJ family cysteine cluster protein [Myxococcota bacterium]